MAYYPQPTTSKAHVDHLNRITSQARGRQLTLAAFSLDKACAVNIIRVHYSDNMETREMDNKLYPKSYNPWAGNPGGVKPDYTRCCEEVRPNERGGSWHMHQCSRKRGFGPDEAYCKQHDPEAVAKRDREAKERWEAASLIRRYEWYGKRFYSVLKQISEGHNDARGLASNMINDFERKK